MPDSEIHYDHNKMTMILCKPDSEVHGSDGKQRECVYFDHNGQEENI